MNECEEFWAGDFGDTYTNRNVSEALLRSKTALFKKALNKTGWLSIADEVKIIEFGANRGLNLQALNNNEFLFCDMTAVEINKSACSELSELSGNITIFNKSIFDNIYENGTHDLVVSMGLLIHIDPKDIGSAYAVIDAACKPGGYVFIGEYFADEPTEVEYRGNGAKLWRRNFGKEFLQVFKEYTIVDYGFVADIDPEFPLSNINWWLVRNSA